MREVEGWSWNLRGRKEREGKERDSGEGIVRKCTKGREKKEGREI